MVNAVLNEILAEQKDATRPLEGFQKALAAIIDGLERLKKKIPQKKGLPRLIWHPYNCW